MNGPKIIRSNAWTPSTLISSGLHPTTTTSGLNATAEELVTTVVLASTARVNLDRTASSRLLSSRARRSLWARVRDAPSVEGMTATRVLPRKPHDTTTNGDGLYEGADTNAPTDMVNPDGPTDGPKADDRADATNAEAHADIADAEAHADIADAEAHADPPAVGDIADAQPSASPAKPASETARVELTIDSLRNYELVKPIPVFVESLGDRHYVAEVPDLNITTSASSLSEILIVLKDSVTQTYDRLRIRRNLDPEQARQLKALETYIGKTKRSWLDRR
jgi:hypothetical protein